MIVIAAHVCMYVCMHVCMYMYVYVCICMYVSNIFTHVCCTLVPEIRVHVHPEMLRIFWYINVLTCMIYN